MQMKSGRAPDPILHFQFPVFFCIPSFVSASDSAANTMKPTLSRQSTIRIGLQLSEKVTDEGIDPASLGNPYAVIVMALTISILGLAGAAAAIPVDILPVFSSPAVQVLTFYGGMPAEGIEKDISNRMERWTGQANGMKRQESRSIIGASIVRNYFQDGQDPNGALTQVNSLALATLPYLPPGTLPPVVLPFDPTSTTPIALVALDSKTLPEAMLYDVGRLEVRNFVMQNPGRRRAGGHRRQAAGGHALPRPDQDAGPQALARRRHERGRAISTSSSPAATSRSATRTIALSSNSHVRAARAHGRHPDPAEPGQVRLPRRDRRAEGFVVHPDQHRPRQRPPAGLHPRLSPGRRQHA